MNARMIVLACLLATVGVPARSAAVVLAPTTVNVYTLEFEPTQNARPGSSGVMTIKILDGGTTVFFALRGGYPNTVYTIWTVFNQLVVPLPTDPSGTAVPACPATGGDPDQLGCPSDARPGFPPEGSPVAPLARLDKPFTDGMGLDQGPSKGANYETAAVRPGIDARYWQCIDSVTALPRVYRYEFDHFRLAPHPDDLTHGLFGGNPKDHFIDMVGRRCRLVPPIDSACPSAFPLRPATQPPATQPPATQPPVTQPPVTQLPATRPPVTQ